MNVQVEITRDAATWLVYCARAGMSVLTELVTMLREQDPGATDMPRVELWRCWRWA